MREAHCEQASTAVREAHCAQATVARLVTFESLKWKYSFATNSALFMKLGSLLPVRCPYGSAKSTAVSNKTFILQVTNIYLFCGSVTFIDLEKAYDRVPREEIWRCMRERNLPEKYVKLIQDMYRGCQTKVRSAAGESGSFNVDVVLHQGSALSPYLFLILMDVLTEGVRKEVPESMMFADDIVLCGGREVDMTEYLDTWKKISGRERNEG